MKIIVQQNRSTAGFEILALDWILIADIDFVDASISEDEKLGEIIGISKQHYIDFRVYRTSGGLRAICISDFFRAAAPVSRRVLMDLGCDFQYINMAERLKEFACRISPKPFRLGIEVAPKFNFYQLLPYEQKQWIEEYEKRKNGFKTCDFILQTSECQIPEKIQNFIKLHDEKTKCELDLPLA